MIITEKQIMELITIAHAYIATAFRIGGAFEREVQDIQKLLAQINVQQNEALKVIE